MGGELSRRGFLRSALAHGAVAGLISMRMPAQGAGESEGTGTGDFRSFDEEMEAFMKPRGIPAGALAVVRQGRLVYARGYGWADRKRRQSTTPDSLFRIASLAKPVTAVAVLRAVEEGLIELDGPMWPVLRRHDRFGGMQPTDSRWERITVRQLLQHTGGWDRDQSYDPMFRSRQIARDQGVPSPASVVDVIRFMAKESLQFDPGTRYAYSNFGYAILGRLLEAVRGMDYGRAVESAVLRPLRMGGMRLGRSREPFPGEVYYSQQAGAMRVTSLWDPTGDAGESGRNARVEVPYGGFCLEAMDAHGGWVASVRDAARFVAAFWDREKCAVLKPETIRTMLEPPPAPVARKAGGELEASWYGCGWMVRPVGEAGESNWWHTGSLPGTFTLMVRLGNGNAWVAFFNRRSAESGLPDGAIDGALHRAAGRVARWPEHDLFGG